MLPIVDCLVSYFGLNEQEQPEYQRFFCYHIVAGPGLTDGSGVACITTLAVYDEAQRCTYCTKVHRVESGGPAAALAVAVRYLDAYHQGGHLRRVQSRIRGLAGDPSTLPVQSPLTHFDVFPEWGIAPAKG
jgi:hypothetical protein